MADVESGVYQGCFVCGTENEAGLQIAFRKDAGGGSRAEFVFRSEHVGWPGIVHGGLLFTLMDEAAAKACTFAGSRCLTAKAEARFRVPARVGDTLVVTGRVTFASSRALRARAEVRNGGDDGELIAELDAMMAIVSPERLGGGEPNVERA